MATVNTGTGVATLLGMNSDYNLDANSNNGVFGLAAVDGVLYGAKGKDLYSINTSANGNGALTLFKANVEASTINGLTSNPGAVPEPASWAMMILGVGAVGFSMRRRKITTKLSYAG